MSWANIVKQVTTAIRRFVSPKAKPERTCGNRIGVYDVKDSDAGTYGNRASESTVDRFGVADAKLGTKDGRPAWIGTKPEAAVPRRSSVTPTRFASQTGEGHSIEKSKPAGNERTASKGIDDDRQARRHGAGLASPRIKRKAVAIAEGVLVGPDERSGQRRWLPYHALDGLAVLQEAKNKSIRGSTWVTFSHSDDRYAYRRAQRERTARR